MTDRLHKNMRLDGRPWEPQALLPALGQYSCSSSSNNSGKDKDTTYSEELSQLGNDAKELGVVAAFTMADQAYASQVKEVAHMAKR